MLGWFGGGAGGGAVGIGSVGSLLHEYTDGRFLEGLSEPGGLFYVVFTLFARWCSEKGKTHSWQRRC